MALVRVGHEREAAQMRLPSGTVAYRSKRDMATGLRDGDFNLVGPHPFYLAVLLLLVLLALRIARKPR